MNSKHNRHNRTLRIILAGAAWISTASLACHAPAVGAQPRGAAAPDMSIGAAQFPDQDALILRWDQHWTKDKDGTVHQRDHQWMKLLNSRPIYRYADPRLDFRNQQDELIIHAARTHLPDGTILPVPDYSFNIVGPDDVAGWPEYADWQQMVVSFSGIEDNAVIELDYEIVTPAGVLPWIDADLRLNEDYPTIERTVSVTLPEGTTLHSQLDRAKPVGGSPDSNLADGMVTYNWTFRNLSAAPSERQSAPWQRRCGRLRFTTTPDSSTWVSKRLEHVDQAATPTEAIKEFAESAVEDEVDPLQRIHKLAKKLDDSFNFVSSYKTMRALDCRSAAEVFQANYGNPLEAAALCLAAVRSLGMTAMPAVGVDATQWDESDKVPPTDAGFAGVVLTIVTPAGPVYLHPQHGVFKNPGNWGQHWLLNIGDAGSLQRTYVYARGEQVPSEIQIAGKLVVDRKGEATGELRINATGAFFDPTSLETTEAQKGLVNRLVGRVLTGLEVPGYSVVTLSDETFRATASVASKGALKDLDNRHVLRFGDGPAFLPEVPMPLSRSYRNTDVELAGRFRENVDLTIELPDGWKPSIIPASPAPLQGPWGSISQSVKLDGKTMRLLRNVVVTVDRLAPDEFDTVRKAVNDLRATQSLFAAFGPEPAGE